jgi:hypothetical protein
MCYHYTNTADRQCLGFEPSPSFLQKDFNKIAEKNLNGQIKQDTFFDGV